MREEIKNSLVFLPASAAWAKKTKERVMTSSTETTNRCMVNIVEVDKNSDILGFRGVVQEGRKEDS